MTKSKNESAGSGTLNSLVSLPICPFCKTEMEPVNYEGYYDSFSYWACECEEFPNVEKSYGEYAS